MPAAVLPVALNVKRLCTLRGFLLSWCALCVSELRRVCGGLRGGLAAAQSSAHSLQGPFDKGLLESP